MGFPRPAIPGGAGGAVGGQGYGVGPCGDSGALEFRHIVVSLKAFDLRTTWLANRPFSQERDYPLHLGITEAGLPPAGIARSALGLGTLLQEGLGDTIRVSLTGDPLLQVRVAREILASLEVNTAGLTLVTCPTCGRCEVDLAAIAGEVERRLRLRTGNPAGRAVVAGSGDGMRGEGPGEGAKRRWESGGEGNGRAVRGRKAGGDGAGERLVAARGSGSASDYRDFMLTSSFIHVRRHRVGDGAARGARGLRDGKAPEEARAARLSRAHHRARSVHAH